MSPIFGENPYLVDGEDVRGMVRMKGTDEAGAPLETWIPKENVAEARKVGLVPSDFIVRRTRRAGGKDIVTEQRRPANVYANIPYTGAAGALTGDPLGQALYALARGGTVSPGPAGGAVVPTAEAGQATPTQEALGLGLKQSTAEVLPNAIQLLTAMYGPKISGISSLLARAGITLGGQTAAQMGAQQLTGEEVDPRAAMTRGGILGSPLAQTALGVVGDVIPFAARGSGRRLAKGGLGASPIGAEEQLQSPGMRLQVKNPVTGKVELQSPRPTAEWTSAASNEVKLLGDRTVAIARSIDEHVAPQLDPMRFNKVVEDDIASLGQTDILSGGPQKIASEVQNRLHEVLGIKWKGGFGGTQSGAPLTAERVLEITRKAGDYASSAMRARLAAAQEGKAMPEADAMEVLARKLWAEGKNMLGELPGGTAISNNATRQFELIQVNELMKRAGMRAQGAFPILTPRGSIPVGTALMNFGMNPSPAPILQAGALTAPIYGALNPPREQAPSAPIDLMGGR